MSSPTMPRSSFTMKASKVKKLTKKQTDLLKQKLLDEKNKLVFSNSLSLEDFNIDNEDRSDEVDQANADADNASRLRFRNREVFYMKKINGALARIEEGEYALCQECGENIRFERLNARPTAEMCIVCKEEAERDEMASIAGRQSKSLGKTIDLTAGN